MIQFGMNGRFFPTNWRPARDEIQFAQQHGFRAIQFAVRDGSLTEARVGDAFALVADWLTTAGLTPVIEIVVFINGAGRTTTGATPLEILQANLPAICGLRAYAAHLHLALNERLTPTNVARLEQSLIPQFQAGVDLATLHGFRFGLEHNEPDLLLFGAPESCTAMLMAVPGLHFVWDLNHTTHEHLAAFLQLTPRMSMLHVSDTPLPEVNYHLPIGQGSIDFGAYFGELQQRGFAGPAILEIGGQPKSGGFGRDTDAALVDSLARLQFILSHYT